MSIHTVENPKDANEEQFLDLMRQGNDFYKIELLRHAKSWYLKARELNPNSELVNQKIADCDRKLAFERKVIWILLGLTAVIIVSYLLVSN